MPKVIAIVQARMGSTRLPGKVLMEAAGKPLILHMLERVSRARLIDELWLATSTMARDDVLAETVESAGHQVFRGDEQDVLGRYYSLASREEADIIVRLTGDCPLHDPTVIDAVVHAFSVRPRSAPFMTNARERTFPVGLDTEVFDFAALATAHSTASSEFEREHVTPFFYRDSAPVLQHKLSADFSHLRWTLDTLEDYELIREVFESLYPINPEFGWLEVLALVTRRPELIAINLHR